MARAKGPSTQDLLYTMNELLYSMVAMMSCPDCEGTGRAPVRGDSGSRVQRSELCDCRHEARKTLEEISQDPDEDDEDEDLDD